MTYWSKAVISSRRIAAQAMTNQDRTGTVASELGSERAHRDSRRMSYVQFCLQNQQKANGEVKANTWHVL